MTDDDLRIKILEKYEGLFSTYEVAEGWINYFIDKFKIDPLDPNTFTEPIAKLRKELDNTVIPEPIEEIWTNIAKEGEAPHYKTVKTYKNHTEEEVEKIRSKWIDLHQHIQYLAGMLNITKLYSPRGSKQQRGSEINKTKQTSKTKYGLLKNIIAATITSDSFKKLNIQKGKTLKQNQQKKTYDIAQKLFPGEVINYNSFISKLKQNDYSKGQLNPRKSKNE